MAQHRAAFSGNTLLMATFSSLILNTFEMQSYNAVEEVHYKPKSAKQCGRKWIMAQNWTKLMNCKETLKTRNVKGTPNGRPT